jgi:hypothetical protein
VTPALRLALSLFASLMLWVPTVPGALQANEDPATIAFRYLIALLVSRIGFGVLFRIINSYAAGLRAADEAAAEKALDEAIEAAAQIVSPVGRRRDDRVEDQAEETASEEQMLDDALDEAADQAALVP